MVLTVLQARNVGSGREGASFYKEDICKCLLSRPFDTCPPVDPTGLLRYQGTRVFWPLDGGHLSKKEEGGVEDKGREREGGKVEAGSEL